MKEFTGVPASPGIASGRVFLYIENDLPEIAPRPILKASLEDELLRFRAALDAAAEELKLLKEKSEKEMGREQSAIFTAHLMMLEDPDFIDEITALMRKELVCSEWALWKTASTLAEKMVSSGNEAFRERASDINDVAKRVLRILLGVKTDSLAGLESDVILAAHDLLPSDLLTMNRARVKGIVTDTGSRTSHTAILARAFNIPAVLGLSAVIKAEAPALRAEIQNGDELLLDGESGKVFVNPEKKILDDYRKAVILNRKKEEEALAEKDLPPLTLDGFCVSLKANIGFPEEAEQALRCGAQGIGLYRSELLYLVPGGSTGEEEQFETYSRVLKTMGPLPVTIRTVDLGGDKISEEFYNQIEKNPLLGWRGIRFCLASPEIFKTQLRAILRASVNGSAKIMFPLISGVEELSEALAVLEEAKGECRKKGQPFAEKIEAGIMIEVPSAAVTSDILAQKSAFFSIGTNDLVQYSVAVDRGNEKVNYLANPAHPAVIRLIKTTIDAAHKQGIKAAMCGEMAGDTLYTALLLGLGLDEFSMSSSAIPDVKRMVRSVSMKDCRAFAEEVLESSSAEKNINLLKGRMKKNLLSG